MDLSVKKRNILGKKVRALRKEGFIPAELYGHGLPNAHLSMTAKDFNKIFKQAGSTSVITLVMDKEKKTAMVHEIGRDSVSGEIIHVDFHQVRMDEKVTAKVPLEFVGEAPAVKEKGAVINKSMSEIEVEAFPQDLPRSISVDLSVLTDIDQSIYVKDLAKLKGVKFLIGEEFAVASATPPKVEEVVAPVETVDVSTVVVETEEKKAEREAGKAAKEEE